MIIKPNSPFAYISWERRIALFKIGYLVVKYIKSNIAKLYKLSLNCNITPIKVRICGKKSFTFLREQIALLNQHFSDNDCTLSLQKRCWICRHTLRKKSSESFRRLFVFANKIHTDQLVILFDYISVKFSTYS